MRKKRKKKKKKKRNEGIRKRRRKKRRYKEMKWWKQCKELANSLFFEGKRKTKERKQERLKPFPARNPSVFVHVGEFVLVCCVLCLCLCSDSLWCVVCPHHFSRGNFPVDDGDRRLSDTNRWPCERRRMANPEKQGMDAWSVACGEASRSRHY